jgi:hypothetical protein
MHCGVEVTESSTNKQHHLSQHLHKRKRKWQQPFIFGKLKIKNAGVERGMKLSKKKPGQA